MENLKIKKALLEISKSEIQRQMSIQKQAMDDAQEEANAHKGAMESRYDSFKEEAQRKKDGHAQQYHQLMKLDSALGNVLIEEYKEVKFGSVVETEQTNYFLFAYIFDEPLEVDGKKYLSINMLSPLGKAMSGLKKGSKVTFNNKELTILEIY
jgi:transcription elongation GreA/GreB family factor